MFAQRIGRREFLRGIASVAAGAALTACVPAQAPTAQQGTAGAAAGTPAAAPVELKIAGWYDAPTKNAVQAQLDLFKDAYPNIQVSIITIEFLPEKNVVMLASGAGPDVFWVNNDQVSFWAARNALAQVDDYMDRDKIDRSDFIEPVQQQIYTYQGKTFSIVESVAAYHLVVNTGMFEEAGVELPPHDYTNPDWTYVQLLEKATALTKRTGSGPADQFGVYFGNGFWGNASVLWSFGTHFMDDIESPTKVTFGSPETVEGHQWLVDLRVKHQVSASVAEEQGMPAGTQFSTGKLAMFATGGWTWPFLNQPEIKDRIKWEVYPLPKGPKGQYCQLAGNSYGMNAATPHAEESWQLLKHVTVGKGATTFFTPENCKGLPATWTLANNPAFLSWFSPGSKQTAMEVHKMGTWFPKHQKWQEVAAKGGAELQEIWTGNMAVDVAVDNAQTAMAAVLTES